MNSIVIFKYCDMNPGGIQTYILNQSRILIASDFLVFWNLPKNSQISHGFKNFLSNSPVRIIEGNSISKNEAFIKSIDSNILYLISFRLKDYLNLESEICRYTEKYFSFLIIPHFEGPNIFLEQYIKSSKSVYSLIQRIYSRLINNKHILFLAAKQQRTFIEHYKLLSINTEQKLIIGNVIPKECFNLEEAIDKSERQEFIIITVSRFELPHKGYILGLINTFAKLSTEYHNLKLQIIGFGPDENIIINEIKKLPEIIQNNIECIGMVDFFDLEKYYRKAHVNISVAGACIAGAMVGTISIPARHYCSACEVYGYLPEALEYTVSTEPGQNVEAYLRELLEMDNDTFINRIKLTTDGNYQMDGSINLTTIIDQVACCHSNIEQIDMIKLRFIYRYAWLIEKKKTALRVLRNPKYYLMKLTRKVSR